MADIQKAEEGNAGFVCCRAEKLQRRSVLAGMAALGGLAATRPAFAQAAEELPPQVGDFLTKSSDGTPLTPDDIRTGVSPTDAYAVSPEGVIRNADFNNAVLVSRFDVADLTPEAQAKAVEGVLAYSVICTHAGCETTGWIRETMVVECPCHGSSFDPKNNGAVVTGPASRKLPQLGLGLQDGKLVVTEVFDSRVGGDETM